MIHCITAAKQGRAILGVVDGFKSKGIETEKMWKKTILEKDRVQDVEYGMHAWEVLPKESNA